MLFNLVTESIKHDYYQAEIDIVSQDSSYNCIMYAKSNKTV